jgi:hypothetical protein
VGVGSGVDVNDSDGVGAGDLEADRCCCCLACFFAVVSLFESLVAGRAARFLLLPLLTLSLSPFVSLTVAFTFVLPFNDAVDADARTVFFNPFNMVPASALTSLLLCLRSLLTSMPSCVCFSMDGVSSGINGCSSCKPVNTNGAASDSNDSLIEFNSIIDGVDVDKEDEDEDEDGIGNADVLVLMFSASATDVVVVVVGGIAVTLTLVVVSV